VGTERQNGIEAAHHCFPTIGETDHVPHLIRRKVRDKDANDPFVESIPGIPHEVLHDFSHRHGLPVRTLRGEGLIHIGHSHNPGEEMDGLCPKPKGIATAVKTLVVLKGNEFDEILKGSLLIKKILGHQRMLTDNPPLILTQSRRLTEDFRGNLELPKIMEERSKTKLHEVFLPKAQELPDEEGNNGHVE